MGIGKKLFGKTNGPLHVLEQYLKFVEEQNDSCFNLGDTFSPPLDPPSRERSPAETQQRGTADNGRAPVFCICRRHESGLMIECEICHEWRVLIFIVIVSGSLLILSFLGITQNV